MKWSLVADLLPGRLGKQCRERWLNHLDPAVKKTGWTSDEDEVIFHAQVIVGHVFLKEQGPNKPILKTTTKTNRLDRYVVCVFGL